MELINKNIISELVKKAKNSNRKRAMYCLHKSNESMLHTMINVILKDSYICPHKHYINDLGKIIKKGESYLILEGKGKLLFFDDFGNINKTIELNSEEKSMVLVPEGIWHSIISISDYIVIFENKTGPWEEGKDKIFHKEFPLEGEEGVKNILNNWYKQ